MREIQYGYKLIRSSVFLRLFHVCFLSILISLFLWILLWTSFFPESHMDMGYWLLAPCVLCYMIHWQAKREPQTFFTFQKDCVWIHGYPKHLYWFLLRKQEPMKQCITYRDIQEARLTYQKAKRRSHREYQLCLYLTTLEKTYTLFLQPSYLSEEAMKGLLLLLSTQISNFQDPYQLQLCLLKNLNMDTYLYSIQERKEQYENK